jgi:triosephosphate isomerase (TIM)
MSDRRPFVGGNWKMNTNRASAAELTRGVVDGVVRLSGVEIAVFPPFPYLLSVRGILHDRGSTVRLGAQDVYHHPDGAFTGEVSTEMLKDCGAAYVLCGHSERRHVLGETDPLINQKVRAVLEAGLHCVLCVGETLEQREAGHTDPTNQRQIRAGLADIGGDHMSRVIIAYEPVWAIGTGKTSTPEDAQDVHAKIRKLIGNLYGQDIANRTRIIYGGSLKANLAPAMFSQPDVDGGLIGGASLKAADFVGIARAASERSTQH